MVPASIARVPLTTYRLQFSAHLTFGDARRLVGYLDALGITDAYSSPLFRAREQSSHGYDVVDHAAIHPDFGTEDDFRAFAEELRGRGMGLLLDVVPNHMGIDDPANLWWQDVLENGMASAYARYFDIDWRPPKEPLQEKVLLPFLGDQFGKVLEDQQIRLAYEDHRFQIRYYDRRFPVAPRSSRVVLRLVMEKVQAVLGPDDPNRMELESVITALDNLPSRLEKDPGRIQQRYREKEVIRRRLAALYDNSSAVHDALDRAVEEYNGRKGDPRSFDRLDALLADQPYRLSNWRVAADEINYRRFFDINGLAAIRVEDPDVFEAVHALIFRFIGGGWITALRIDHPDGLLDPEGYFSDLQARFRQVWQGRAAEAMRQPVLVEVGAGGPAGVTGQVGPPGLVEQVAILPSHRQIGNLPHNPSLPGSNGHGNGEEAPAIYLAVEKVLACDEGLPAQWPVCGTTGYDFLNQLNGLFVDRRGVYALQGVYRQFTGMSSLFADVLYQSKRLVLTHALSAELHVLSGQLDQISEQHRWSRDFTRSALHRALREVIACFPVYRTYVRPGDAEVRPEDRRRILVAIRTAKRRNPQTDPSYFDFVAAVLLLEDPDGLTGQQRADRRQFVLKFQQVTGPVMAKGLEDTAFYRYYPLASLNEVGGDPTAPGVKAEEFHRWCQARLSDWPYSMSATATHDTKRGEDVRARLNVLSEVPDEWEQAIRRWHAANARFLVGIDGADAPDANEEYLLYQTLVGTWPWGPLEPDDRKRYVERIVQYMGKALKEAKVHASWTNPNEEYDQAVTRFVQSVLDPRESGEFLDDLGRFAGSIADAGWINSLAQTLLKITLPGVPDFYQGTELWDFSLVDPDNRRPVDFVLRQRLLGELRSREDDLSGLAAELTAAWPDPRIKLHLIWRSLGFRREHADLFLHGTHAPLEVEGPESANALAFAREHEGQWAVVVVPRLTAEAWRESGAGGRLQGFAAWWRDTSLQLPADAPAPWRHVLTGEVLSDFGASGDARTVLLDDLFRRYPVALLATE